MVAVVVVVVVVVVENNRPAIRPVGFVCEAMEHSSRDLFYQITNSSLVTRPESSTHRHLHSCLCEL